ncbi:hypothetical protein ASD67_17705 [Sphingopyxis sp. Root1497]|nr:hypothetical protein ASD67_17705 [Sphingopyxis sp. Root1497]
MMQWKAIAPRWRAAGRQARLVLPMLWGWQMPGLAEIVRGLVGEHMHTNPAARAYRYPLLKRAALWSTRHARLALVAIFLAYASAVALGRGDWLPAINLPGDAAESIRDFWTVNVGILGVQAALVGLVFPLVIAFVGLLNQGRASFASRLTIYIDASAAVFVGLSSLLLCVAVAIQLVFASLTPQQDAAAATLVNLVWFIVNAGALAYFILRTIAFLHPGRRTPLMRAYVANVVWPRELGSILMQERWESAVPHGYLPRGLPLDSHDEKQGARTWYTPYADWGTAEVRRSFRSAKRLVDIKPFLLTPVVRAWLRDVEPLARDARHDLVLTPHPGQEYDSVQILARATHPLGALERIGVRAAFIYRDARANGGEIGESAGLLQEMIADLIALVDGRQHNEFTAQLREIMDFHVFLYELAQRPDADFNYAVRGSGHGMFGHMETLGPSWAQAYRDLISRTVERLSDEPAFVGTMAYAPARIYGRAARVAPPDALRPLIMMAGYLGYRLTEWAVAEHRGSRPDEAGISRDFILSRQEENYARAWREMASGWERLFHAIAIGPDWRSRGERSWRDFQRIAGNVAEHLRETASLAGRAIWLGDLSATSWTCDLLLHWRVQAERAWDIAGNHWRYQSAMLTLPSTRQPWAEIAMPPLFPADPPPSPAIVFGAIMQNAWRDHLVALASASIHWALNAGAAESATRAARMLLRNEPHDRGDIGHHGDEPFTDADILVSLLRIRSGGDPVDGQSYAGMFEHLFDEFSRFGEPPTVSWRLYSSSGGLSFGDLAEAHVVTLMAAQSRGGVARDLEAMLADPNDDALRDRESYLEALLAAAQIVDADQHMDLLARIGGADAAPFLQRLAETRALIETSLEALRAHRIRTIAAAVIDPRRMMDFARAADRQAFAPVRFPLSQFRAIEATQSELPERSLRASGLGKGNFVDPPMGYPIADEEGWWSDVVATQIAAGIWADILGKASFEARDGRTPETFWHAVRDGSRAISEAGNRPLLVLATTASPDWVRGWRWPHFEEVRKPDDLVITEGSGSESGPAFSMNGTPVFEAATGFGEAYLLPAELLERLQYRRFENGLAVTASFESDPANPWKGTIISTWQRDMDLADLPILRIRFADRDGGAGRTDAQS